MLKLCLALTLACTAAPAATQLVILGTGTPRADPARSGPAVAVIYNGRAYLFDSGPGVVRRAAAAAGRLKIAALQAPRLNRVFLTHLHSDHTMGLPDLIFSPWVLGRKEPLDLYGPKGTTAMAGHLEAAWEQDIDVRIHGLERANTTGYQVTAHDVEAGVVYREGDFKVTAFAVHHGSWAQAFGYRIDTPDRSIVISGDCTPSAALVDACNGCDVLLHEVYSLVDAKRPEPGWIEYLREFHTSSTELAQVAAKAKPKLLVMYHQLIRGTTDKALLKDVRKNYRGRVVSAHDLDLY
jgi:ribonuclease BN (tRNA processing enzyme)